MANWPYIRYPCFRGLSLMRVEVTKVPLLNDAIIINSMLIRSFRKNNSKNYCIMVL